MREHDFAHRPSYFFRALLALETDRPGRLNEIGYPQPRVAPASKTGDRRSYAATYYDRHAAAAASSGYGC